MAVFRFIEGWYNPHRRHSGLDYESPVSFDVNGHRKLHRSGHRKLHTWRR